MDDDNFEALILEMAALEAITEAARGEGPAGRAVELAREAWAVRSAPTTFEEHVTHTALARVIGEQVTTELPSPSIDSSWTKHVYERTTLAWLRWVRLGDGNAAHILDQLREEEPDVDRAPSGAVELQALSMWGQAIISLTQGDTEFARRLFERAIETGSQIGSDSNPTINWSYAASFFRNG